MSAPLYPECRPQCTHGAKRDGEFECPKCGPGAKWTQSFHCRCAGPSASCNGCGYHFGLWDDESIKFTQKFKVGDRVIASPVAGYEVKGEVTYAGTDGAVEVIEDGGGGGMFEQRMVRLENAAVCPKCEERHKNGGAGLCSECAQAVIDKSPELQALQAKGKAVLDGLSRGASKYGAR